MLNIRYYKHALWVNDVDTAFIGVVTLWTMKQEVVEQIVDKSKILTVGNLYTLQGFEWIVRNVCANPRFQYLIIVGKDNNNVVPILSKRETNLTNNEAEIVFWNYFRNHISFVEYGHNMYDKMNNIINHLKKSDNWILEPLLIPEPEKVSFSSYESEESGFVVRDNDLYRLWQRALLMIKMFGVETNGTREVMNITSVLTKKPFIDKRFPAFDRIESYLPQVCTNNGSEGLTYTYGQRLFGRNQIDSIVDLLSRDVLKRQAVATTWQPPDDYIQPAPPCLVLVTFRIHPCSNNTYCMYMTTVFRSHDMYKAFGMNLFALWRLGEIVLNRVVENTHLNISFKSLTNLSISAHVYEADLKLLSNVERLNCNLDYRGYFVITLLRNERKLQLALMNSNNQVVEQWISDDVRELCDACQIFISDVSHALYMGRELSRAMQCLMNGTKYVQQ